MDLFNALWDDPEQRKRPPNENFQLFSMEDWLAMSSTHKILTGSLQCPLPPEVESTSKGKWHAMRSQKQNERNEPGPNPQGTQINHNVHKPMDLITRKKGPYVPGFTKFAHLTRVSCLTSREHKDCLHLFLKFSGKSFESFSPSEVTEYQLFQSLYSRVKAEQVEFLEIAKLAWPEFVDRTGSLISNQYNYFLQYWVDKVTRAMAQYPVRYKKLKMITLHGKTMMDAQLQFIKNLLNIGKIPILNLPKFEHMVRVSSNINKLRSWALLNVPPTQLAGTLHNVPVSRDPNAERLARLHGANIVISTGGLKCLLDNHNEKKHLPRSGVGKSWILPVIVKEHRTFCNGKPATKTIVFIDKPLPPAKVTPLEKVSWFQKHGLFAAMTNHSREDGINFDIKGNDIFVTKNFEESAPEHLLQAASATLTSFEINGLKKNEDNSTVSTINKISKLPDMTDQSPVVKDISNVSSDLVSAASVSDISENDDDSSDENALTIMLSDEETRSDRSKPSSKIQRTLLGQYQERTLSEKLIEVTDSETSNTNVQKENIVISENLDTINREESLAKPTEPAESIDTSSKPTVNGASKTTNKWENVPAPSQVTVVNGNALPPCFTNVTYNMWSLQSQVKKDVTDQAQSQCSGNFNLLIRSRIDGCEQLSSGSLKPLSLASKPEFQLEYGPGVVSLSDLTRQWAKLLIQPDTFLARIRVNANTGELVKTEKRTMAEIQNEAQIQYNENLTDTLQTLKEVLSELLQLPRGQYILSHSPLMGSATELLLQANEGETVDLNLAADYGSLPDVINCDIPWQPLDPKVPMPKNIHVGQMPCTFRAPYGPLIVSKPRKPVRVKPVYVKQVQKKKKKKKKKLNSISAVSNE